MAVHLLDELLHRLPSDCERRVRRSKDEYNRVIRTHLTRETNLSLRRGRRGDHDDVEIAVRVMPGLPACLEQRLLRTDEDRIKVLIALYESDIVNLRASAQEVARLVSELARINRHLPECDERYTHALEDSIELANLLLERSSADDFLMSLLFIQDDILGQYIPKDTGGEIHLYWAAIGIFARLLRVEIEHLTAVVLAHELAHGYTHLGKDADHESWDTETMFRRVDRAVVEGLAQYYTDIVSEALGDTKAAGVHEAYLRLRRRQRGYYRVHDRWVEAYTSEVVRSALLEYRRQASTSRYDFERMLETERGRLKARPKDLHERVQDDLERFGPLHNSESDALDEFVIEFSTGADRPTNASSFLQRARQSWGVEQGGQPTPENREWTFSMSSRFSKATRELDRSLKGKVLDAIQEIASSPLSARGDTVERLTGNLSGLWRYRVGDYRILYRVDQLARLVVLISCEHRSSVYAQV